MEIDLSKPILDKNMRLAAENRRLFDDAGVFVLDLMAHGMTVQEILGEYPGLVHADVSACLLFASRAVRDRDVEQVDLAVAGHQRSVIAQEHRSIGGLPSQCVRRRAAGYRVRGHSVVPGGNGYNHRVRLAI